MWMVRPICCVSVLWSEKLRQARFLHVWELTVETIITAQCVRLVHAICATTPTMYVQHRCKARSCLRAISQVDMVIVDHFLGLCSAREAGRLDEALGSLGCGKLKSVCIRCKVGFDC